MHTRRSYHDMNRPRTKREMAPYGIDSLLYSSLDNLDYTYESDKLSCMRSIYFAHVTLANLVTMCAVMCFVCRLFRSIMWLHPHFGRAYIILMMWLMTSSLVLHTTGLPIVVLISFVCVLGGITFGWMCIKWHQAQMERKVFAHLCTKTRVTEKSFRRSKAFARQAFFRQGSALDADVCVRGLCECAGSPGGVGSVR